MRAGRFPRDIGAKLNAIDFSKGWAPGLAKLLELLSEDGVPSRAGDNRALLADFWRTSYPAQEGVSQSHQPYTSNWFPLDNLPTEINFHHVGLTKQKIETAKFEYPTERNGEYLVSFAKASTLGSEPGMRRTRITETKSVALEQFLGGKRIHKQCEMERHLESHRTPFFQAAEIGKLCDLFNQG